MHSYDTFNGSLLKQIDGCDKISFLTCSHNGAYFISGDAQGILKVWDYEAEDNEPFYYQLITGHRSSPRCMIVGDKIISSAIGDGVHFFEFHGDLTTDYNPKQPTLINEVCKETGHPKSGLEKLMRSVA